MKLYNWANASIEVKPSGTMFCQTCGQDSWCHHIELALKNDDDAEEVWDQTRLFMVESFPLVVPIFPTCNLFHTVVLKPIEFAVPALSVTELGTKNFLGYLTQGDGRSAVRSMLISNLFAQNQLNECTQKTHGFKQQMTFEKNMKDKKGRLVETWCLYQFGICISCHDPMAADDFNDLIPDKESNWS